MKNKETCKLYRKFYEIIHPSISRKNISEYKIIFQDDMIPVQVFYPNKEIELNHIIIYILGSSTYDNYYENLAKETKHIVILLNSSSKDKKEDYSKVIDYIIDEALQCKIKVTDITLMSDFYGTDWILDLEEDLNNKKYKSLRKILLSPSKEDLSKYSSKNTFILSNNEEQIANDKMSFNLIKESIYDFMKDSKSTENDGIYLKILNIFNGNEG